MRIALLVSLVCLVSCGDVVTNKPDAPPEDPCANATCECTTATEVADCGAHATCNVDGPGRVCECVAAYSKSGGGACTFSGAPANPQMSDPAIWTSVGAGPAIDTAAAGNVDPGEAVLDQTSMCGLATFKQTFKMPPLDRAEPFKLVVTHTLTDPTFFTGAQVAVGVGKQWIDLPLSRNVYRTDTICLGADAYGGSIDFRVAAATSPSCASQTAVQLRIDRVAVEVAGPGECPAPGTVTNGNFEAATGWTFGSIGSATGGILAGAGEAATAGGRISGVNRCSEGTLTGTVAFPTRATVANPAIDMFVSGNNGDRLLVGLNGRNVQTVVTTSAGKHARMCVPDWAMGTTAALSFFMQRVSDNACSTALVRTFSMDNITIVSDPACSATTDITDAGFERVANVTGPVTGWGLTNGYVNDTEGVNTNVVNFGAHTGNAALRMFWSNQCTGAEGSGADVTVLVPPSSGAAGPAVKFFSNSPVANTMTVTRLAILPHPNSLQPWSVDALETGAYVQSTLCLPPQYVGRPVRLRATLGNPGGGGCLATQPTETALFDDFTVTTDAACPAQ